MKNILLLIHDDAGQEARLQAALDVTRALGGHLTCLDVAAVMPFVGEATGVQGGAMLIEMEMASETVNAVRLGERLRHEDVSWDWLDTVDYVEPALEKAAGLADLIVVNRALDTMALPDLRHLAAALAVRSGKPILAVPDGVRGMDVAGRALVAWDGSDAAMAALQAATPLLALAEDVTLLEVDDGSVTRPAEEAAAYLSRHGIHPRIVRLETGFAGALILAEARTRLHAYLVMGGFSHSRFREALLGGVTRRMLDESPIPLFLAH